jgi:hypothetical protein
VNVAENSTAVLTATATDADLPAQTLSFSIVGGADQSKFAITSGGVLTFQSAPDFESPTDTGTNNVYNVTIQASDGNGRSSTQDIAVTVTAVNDNSPVITSSASVNVAENSTAVLTATATDADLPSQTLSFSIVGGADQSKFAITSGGVLTFQSAPDFESPTDTGTNNVYNVTIQASDGNGRSSTQDIAVTVTDVSSENAETFLTTLVSADQQAGPPATGNDASSDATISADGRYVAFVSRATNLVVNQQDVTFTPDVFLFDRTTGTTRLLTGRQGSTTQAGTVPQASGNVNQKLNAVVSADGKFVAFTSRANDLIAGQLEDGTGSGLNSGYLDLFLYDVTNQTTKLISHSRTDPKRTGAFGDVLGLPSISADGRFVTFASDQRDLVTGVTTTARQVYLYDRGDGQTPESLVLVSHTSESVTTPGGSFFDPVVSADGRFVAFMSSAPNMVPGQTLTSQVSGNQVYLYDRLSPTGTILVSGVAGSATQTSDAQCFGQMAISAHGRLVAFVSFANNLVSGQLPNRDTEDIFLFDRLSTDPASRVRLVSHIFNSDVTESDRGFETPVYRSSHPVINVDLANATDALNGLFVAFLSYGSQIVEGLPANERRTKDLFLYSVGTGANVLVNHALGAASTPANRNISIGLDPTFPRRAPWISSDGRFLAYEYGPENLASNLVDSSITGSVIRYDRLQNTNTLLDGANPSGVRVSTVNGISGDGSVVIFSSTSTNLVADDSNLAEDVFVSVKQATPSNANPVITSSANVSIAENTTAVLTVTATDADRPAQSITFSIVGGVDAAKFSITSGGVLTFQSAPDFESPTDSGTNNVYNVTVRASDGVGGTATQDIAVTVTDVSENLVTALVVDTLSDSSTDGANTSSITALLANKGADGKISLREAIVAANNTPGANTITFDASLTAGGPGTIRLNGTELVISSDLTISGPTGEYALVISGDRDDDGTGNSRVFRIDDGVTGTNAIVTISNLAIVGGHLPEFQDGAGILNRENLTLLQSNVSNNSTDSTSGFGGGALRIPARSQS